jgi:hypothetical protein
MDPGARPMSAPRMLGAAPGLGSPWRMAQAAGQLLLLPWSVFTSMVAAGLARLAEEAKPGAGAAIGSDGFKERTTSGAPNTSAGTTIHKETKMSYEDACGEEACEIQLYSYTIVTIKRGAERILFRGAKLVTDPMDQCEFDAWVIAEYLQSPEHKKNQERPQDEDEDRRPIVHEGDKRWLRVSSEIQHTWGKQPLHYRERQLQLLQKIADK